MRTRSLALLITGVLLTSFGSTARGADATTQPAARAFAHPGRIRYDGQCLTIDGKDLVIYSGAFHYFRCPRELWRDRFARIKQAGFNTVETYVAWNVHEPEMPKSLDDFSKVDLGDVDTWLTMAEEFGLYVIIRPGPYICAEWDRGGFPGWLITKRPAKTKEPEWFRSDDPEFIAWSRHWFDAVNPLLAKHQITRKKPGEAGIILYQLENEYDYAKQTEAVKAAYVKALAEAAVAKGIDVPLFTCWTRPVRGSTDPVLRNVFDSCNFYPGWNVDSTIANVERLRAAQPDAPVMTTELQGGWFTRPNEEPPIRPDSDHYRNDLGPAQIQNLTLLMLQHGETITNYYMLFGGTNFGDTAAHEISTSYDYSAPLRECGGIGEKYQRVAAIGRMLQEHGPRLARATFVETEAITGSNDVTAVERRAADGSRYIFVRTPQHVAARNGTVHLKEKAGGAELTFDYQLEPMGSEVLYLAPGVTDAGKGEWLPKAAPPIARPASLPAAVKMTDVRVHDDPPGTDPWKAIEFGQTLNDLGIYDSRFVYYTATLILTDADLKSLGRGNLRIDHPREDRVALMIEGKHIAGAASAGGSVFAVKDILHEGKNLLFMLYENGGAANGGAPMQKRAGITAIAIVPDVEQTLGNWKIKPVRGVSEPEKRPEIAGDLDDSDWAVANTSRIEANQVPVNTAAVFRSTLELSDVELKSGKTVLSFQRIDDDGWVFVNGQKVGEAHAWDQTHRFDVAKQLHAGKNSIAVLVHNGDGAGGLGPVGLELATSASIGRVGGLSICDQTRAHAMQWAATDLNDDGWAKESLPAKGSNSAAMVTWHRLTFELPTAKSDQWVPWLIHLQTTGNGFLYVNGHPLGRTWEAGRQHDYYLPECWLNFGPGKKNVVTLCLRVVDKPVAVESAEVMPYADYAEKR